ncbi:invertase/pectin methylesterase inhibitor family protein [Striga asiatica]|uniref:Invertase/pectin methylesterase inhibitor family protein n=1 Tax=Striga asiatica TaxID=4170 RepID=A0A5A7QR74_STRAF|nr:invertase/pectin methylesterase inhibitor family protein [Striga asiatica]
MNKLSSFPLLSLLFVVSNLIDPSFCDSAATQRLIKDVCIHTSDYNWCTSILSRNLVSPDSSLQDITKLTMDIAVSAANFTHSTIRSLETIVKRPNVKQLLVGCEGNYNTVVTYLEFAKSAAYSGSFEVIPTWIFNSNKHVYFCQNKIKNVVPLIFNMNKKMRVLFSMATYEALGIH